MINNKVHGDWKKNQEKPNPNYQPNLQNIKIHSNFLDKQNINSGYNNITKFQEKSSILNQLEILKKTLAEIQQKNQQIYGQPLYHTIYSLRTRIINLTNKQRLIQKEKESYISLFNQLKHQKQLLVEMNNKLLDDQHKNRERIKNLQKEYVKTGNKHHEEKMILLQKLENIKKNKIHSYQDQQIHMIQQQIKNLRTRLAEQQQISNHKYNQLLLEYEKIVNENKKMNSEIICWKKNQNEEIHPQPNN